MREVIKESLLRQRLAAKIKKLQKELQIIRAMLKALDVYPDLAEIFLLDTEQKLNVENKVEDLNKQ